MMTIRKSASWSYVALITCLIASVCDLAALAVFAHFYPAYDPYSQPISGLGASGSPIARLVSLWWIFLGLIFLTFAFAYQMSNCANNRAQHITSWLIATYAVGEEIGSGVFPGNHLAGHLTAMGIIHNITGGIGIVALVAIPFVLMNLYTRSDHPAFNRFLLVISLTGMFFFLLFSISRLNLPELQWLRSWHGLWQRLFVANYYIMLAAIAVKQVPEAGAGNAGG
jgi:hypothetical protein